MLTFIYFIFYSAPQNKFPGQMYLDNKDCDSVSDSMTNVKRNSTWQLTAKESKQVAEDKAKLTEHFIITLPQLLLKVGLELFHHHITSGRRCLVDISSSHYHTP